MTVPETVQSKLDSLPAKPGVYIFKDKKAAILYVGKAKSLRSRVRSYFQEGASDNRQFLPFLQKMVADLNFPVTIVPVPTVREHDGLAMSSRNQRLTPEQRRIAPVLYQALGVVPSKGRGAALELLASVPEIRVDYLEIVDPATFQPVNEIAAGVRIVAAVWLGEVRLIDNLPISIR